MIKSSPLQPEESVLRSGFWKQFNSEIPVRVWDDDGLLVEWKTVPGEKPPYRLGKTREGEWYLVDSNLVAICRFVDGHPLGVTKGWLQ